MSESYRQLAAIMFTDIVGYTSLMGQDSSKALELVRKNKEIQRPLVERHNGQWLKEMGDGTLSRFGSALDALNCAVEIQEAARAKFDGKIRIGIHLGDITIEKDDVFGDGVNVASRLESIADPGGIYVSESIEKAIQGQTKIQAKYLGEAKLKNVSYGVRTYAIQGVGLPVPEVKETKNLTGHLWAEVLRRGILRAAATYIVLSLLLLLLLPYADSLLSLPSWAEPTLSGILLAGFPIAILLAWHYERSPQGFVRTSSSQSWQNPYSASQRKPLTGNIIVGVLGLAIIIVYYLPGGSNNQTWEVTSAPVLDKSIAVLPFSNISNDPDQEYFADGLMEEIINHLVKIEQLKVVSRTSAMNYKGSSKSIREIALELGVATVLEGSVRKEGDQVRISVQLIDGVSDIHLFSESYDRKLTSVFEVESEVAKLVANALQAKITPEVKLRIEEIPTHNARAYEFYLKGRQTYHTFWQEWDASELREGIAFYNQALALDPEFSNAYAGLGQSYWMMAHFSPDYDPIQWDLSKQNLLKAIELDPDNGWAYAELGVVQHNWDWDRNATLRSFEKAVELNPGDFHVRQHRRNFFLRLGDCNQAEEESRKRASLRNWEFDPDFDMELLICRRDMDRIRQLSKSGWPFDDARLLMFQGRYKEALELIQNSDPGPELVLPMATIRGEAHALLGDSAEAMAVIEQLNQLSQNRHVMPGYISPIYMALGDHAKAYQQLEESLERRDMLLHVLTSFFVSMYNVQDDPRFVDIMERSWIPKE